MKRLAFGLLALAALAPSVLANVVHVPTDYAQIHDAVQAAAAGDTVLVAAGTYQDCTHETEGPGSTPACVIMKSGITLRGSGTAATTIDAAALGRGIFIENVRNCRVENLQIRGAFAAVFGAGLLIRQVDTTVEITDVEVTLCTDGGVVCINHAHPVLTRVDCIGNAAKQGGGLSIEEYSHPLVRDCLISGNEAPSGAGVFIRNNSDAVLSRCTITGNTISTDYGQGGGIFVNESNPIITNCDISDNVSRGNGGGMSYQLGSGGRLENCTITGNELIFSFINGAGVAVDSSSPEIVGCLFAGNLCTGSSSDGAALSVIFSSAAPTLSMCTIVGNATSAAGSVGGILAQFGAAPVIDRCIIAFATAGAGLACSGATPLVSCSDFFGNSGGDAVCGSDLGGNISQDPLFCAAGDYRLGASSPCLNVCGGPIGARPVGCTATGVATPRAAVELLGNYPNPFNPTTAIVFRLDVPGRARVRISDVSGHLVATLTLGDLPAGLHEVVWDGTDDDGAKVASGVYLYELEALNTHQTRRMILIK